MLFARAVLSRRRGGLAQGNQDWRLSCPHNLVSRSSPAAAGASAARSWKHSPAAASARSSPNNSNRAAADEVVAEAEQAGARAAALQLDTGSTAAFPDFVVRLRKTLAAWGAERFDFLVNDAGTSHHAPIADVTEADFDALFRVHVKGVFFLTQAVLPLIADGGRIVNISSSLTRVAYPGSTAYASMKGAVEVMTRYMAKELGECRITANVVAPGAVQTDFSGGIVRDNPDMNRRISEFTALGRPGLPEDIGPMIAALLSEGTVASLGVKRQSLLAGGIVGGLESLSEAGTERSIVNGAAHL
jgi:NAD(P)-dependent dehydrogenase (short-subunit alcohol dehydrogenase family)